MAAMPDLLADDPLLAVLPREDGKPRLGSVVIEGVLGRGPMGALFLGRHVIKDVPVAIKTLSNTLDADTKKKFLSLMRRDAKYAARIRHPNIIGTFGYEEVGGQPFVRSSGWARWAAEGRRARGPASLRGHRL